MDSILERQVRSHQPPAGLTFERISTDVAPEVARIAAASFPQPWSEKDFRYFLAHHCASAWGAFIDSPDGRQLAGYFIGLLLDAELDIISLATRAEYRRWGIARKLISHVLSLPAVSIATLEVDVANLRAIRLYESIGFSRVGVRKRYYANKNDALFMRWVE